jgi:hypothetical protein
LLEVRNGTNYNTRCVETVVRHNTFVAGAETTAGIEIAATKNGMQHDLEFCDNAVLFDLAPADVPIASGSFGARHHHNGWSKEPPVSIAHETDVTGALGFPPEALTQPQVTADEKGFSINLTTDYYKPLPDSPLVGKASDKLSIGAFEPLPVEPPDPVLDMTALLALAEQSVEASTLALALATKLRDSFLLAVADE